MATFKLMLARFPGFCQEHPDSTTWYAHTLLDACLHPQIGRANVREMWVADTPITMSRNRVCHEALKEGCDYLLMLDADMKPDYLVGEDPLAKPFFPTAWDFLMRHRHQPCCVAAPYCGPSPDQTVYVARWTDQNAGGPSLWPKLEAFSRDEAAHKTGFEEVGGLATGVMLIDCRVLQGMERPASKQQEAGQWFDYEWSDPPANTKKATTEDYFFTRNARFFGFPQYVAWDCWAGHWKPQLVGKPSRIGADAVSREIRGAIARGLTPSTRIMEIRNGQHAPPSGAIKMGA